MPTKVSYMSTARTHHHHTQERHHAPRIMPDITIGVQPPKRTRAGACLYPPVVAKQSVRESDPDVDYFATAVLLDRQGSVVDGFLEGTKAASRFEVAQSKTAPASFVFPFTDLSISQLGTYTIRVDVYQVSPGDSAGAALVEQLATRVVSVFDADIPSETPSDEERSLMRRARDAGLPMPSSP
ncbi:Uncharacterized protein TPAR_08374 [Tolypocladium paradoxum]|uniref:Velvet domain-containing protein n=1 Tax=Tolypocladium paradoxum TaxID=94208 RepID=A0A2S4KMJ4_9HYPO|nr:Uncharacterized protein TPAR_08374 [Tolypocladium paradoxum]